MKSIAFFTNKGGVGKTTLLCNLAAYFSKEMGKKILVVDADPQTNATQYMFDNSVLDDIYQKKNAFTIYSVAKPLAQGKGYTDAYVFRQSDNFEVDVLLGDPRFALIEDTLAQDWSTSNVRGLRTTFMFKKFLEDAKSYDFVFFDMGPSLGSINRSVLIGCDFFVVPISIDIFSIRATENISVWLGDWKKRLARNIEGLSDESELEVADTKLRLRLLGYVSQQYTAKRNSLGERRAVKAYDEIMQKIPKAIDDGIISSHQKEPVGLDYELGTIPNLHSLIPMSQTRRKPIFSLRSSDGVVGAHFAKVDDAKLIFSEIAERFLENLKAFK